MPLQKQLELFHNRQLGENGSIQLFSTIISQRIIVDKACGPWIEFFVSNGFISPDGMIQTTLN